MERLNPELVGEFYRRSNAISRITDAEERQKAMGDFMTDPKFEPINEDNLDDVADRMAEDHFEAIFRTRYLQLFGITNPITFTQKGKWIWREFWNLQSSISC